MNKKKRALVVEGGAMRGIFSIGVLDAFIEAEYYDFDMCIGVSAGGTTLAAYLAGMYGRNFRVTADYSTRKEFINIFNYFKGGHFMDLDWLWTHCERYDPLNIEQISRRNIDLYIGVTSVESGNIEYIPFTKDNGVELLKATCALPIAYRKPVEVNNLLYFDGGISDPIPVEEAIRRGATEIIVIRSRKKPFKMENKKNKVQDFLLRDYPKINESLSRRSRVYNSSLDTLRKTNSGINIIEINPPEAFQTSRFTQNQEILITDYNLGLDHGRELLNKI